MTRVNQRMEETKKRILIVDDEEDLTWSLSRRLGRDSFDLEVHCANSGHHALDVFKNHRIDLLVTDLRMPGIDGIELVSRVKDQYPQTSVIVMTAYGTVDAKEALNKIGIMGYIEKPFEFDEFKKLIHQNLTEAFGPDRLPRCELI